MVGLIIPGDTELDFLRKRLQETEKAMERIVAKMMSLPNYSHPPEVSLVLASSQFVSTVSFFLFYTCL